MLLKIARQIFAWVELHLQELTASSGDGEHDGRLSKQMLCGSQAMGIEPSVSATILRSDGNRLQHQGFNFFSCYWDPRALAQDALLQPWRISLGYVFPPFPLILRVLLIICQEETLIIAILHYWAWRPWFNLLGCLQVTDPIPLPLKDDLLQQGHLHHPSLGHLNLMA